MSDILRIALVQMASTPDVDENLETVTRELRSAAGYCDLAVFPENVLCLGRGRSVRAAARTMPDLLDLLGGLCREAGVPAVFGGVAVRDGDGIANASLAFDDDGTLMARYDKMHLFRLNDGNTVIDETRLYAHGARPISFDFRGWDVALTICYDLRFPELFRACAPCDLAICTAAFTARTGPPHWELLLRARAVEGLCCMVGVGQCGTNSETGVANHGHSMAVGPWGDIIRHARGDAPSTTVATLHKARIAEARRRLPALDHRRLEVTRSGPGGRD